MVYLNFNKDLKKYAAFTHYLAINNIDLLIDRFVFNSPTLDVWLTDPISQEQVDNFTTLVNNYNEPPYFLIFDHTEDQFLRTVAINTSYLSPLQSWIQSPDFTVIINPIKLGDIKILVELTTTDASVFDTWDPIQDPISISLQIFNVTTNQVLVTQNTDITNIITSWKNKTGYQEAHQTIQLYGFVDLTTNFSNIWKLLGSVTNSNVYLGINSVQKIYYQIEE